MALTLKGVLATVLPTLASFLPGPLGGMAKQVIADALGKPEASDAEIEKMLASVNPEMLLRLKQAEQEFAVKMEQMGIDAAKVAAADRASARDMQVHTQSWLPAALAITLTCGFMGTGAVLIFRTFPTANTEVLMLMLGNLAAGFIQMLQFYYGTSVQSRSKDQTIENLSK